MKIKKSTIITIVVVAAGAALLWALAWLAEVDTSSKYEGYQQRSVRKARNLRKFTNLIGQIYQNRRNIPRNLRRIMPFGSFVEQNTLGELTWTLAKDNTLTISGNGAMPDFGGESDSLPRSPWTTGKDVIEKVVIEEGVTSIGSYAFSGQSKLTSITIPASVARIGNSAFGACRGLTEIALPDGLQQIEGSTFYNCASLASVTIPEGVTSIADYAFGGCGSLDNLTLPASVSSIGLSSFEDCPSLVNVTCLAVNPPQMKLKNFQPTHGDTLHVPAGSVDVYKTNVWWKISFDNIVAVE